MIGQRTDDMKNDRQIYWNSSELQTPAITIITTQANFQAGNADDLEAIFMKKNKSENARQCSMWNI